MSFVKAICGAVIHKNFTLSEGQITEYDDDLIKKDWVLRQWEKDGLIKICKEYEDAVEFKFKGIQALAAESLPSLNPPTDSKGNLLAVAPATFDFVNSKPIKASYNYL